jgi:hypothetical protein
VSPVVGGVGLHDVGPDLNRCFESLYLTGRLPVADFRTAAFAYFDRTPNPDPLAFNFAVASLPNATATVSGTALWEFVLGLMHEWEEVHPGRRLHKGGAYYFAAIRDIVVGNLDRGFLYMHQAAMEDLATHGRGRTPAKAFITLDPRMQNQAFKAQVEVYSAYLQRRLASYRKHRGGRLTLPDMRKRFDRHPQLREPLFVLAFAVACLVQSGSPEMRRVRGSELARVVLAGTVLDLALVVEELLSDRYRGLLKGRPPTFVPLAVEYANAHALAIGASLPSISAAFNRGFDRTMTTLLRGRLPAHATGLVSKAELDLAVVVGLRNHAAHGVGRSTLVGDRFEILVRRTFFFLFAVIENCYA